MPFDLVLRRGNKVILVCSAKSKLVGLQGPGPV